MIRLDRDSSVPLHRQLYDHFRSLIVEGSLRDDARLPSIRQLQRMTGLAAGSIKRALDDLARDGLVRKIHGKGIFVARREGTHRFVGLSVPFYAEYYNKIIVELRRVFQEQGVDILHRCDYDDWERQLEIVDEFALYRPEAIIVVPTRDEAKTLTHFRKMSRQFPIVLMDRSSIASQLPYVIQDYVQGVRVAMESMARGGARRIAYVRDPLWMAGNQVYRTMEEAYAQVKEEMGGDYLRVYDSPESIFDGESGRPDFDGVMCVNDKVACLVIGLLMERGIDVPGKVQVAGYNDSDFSRFFTPRISTTSPDLPGMCNLAHYIVERSRSGQSIQSLQYVSIPRLIERGSTRGV